MITCEDESHESNRGPVSAVPPSTCRCADWYAEGESRVVECDGVRVVVRYVGRKGRRGRIVIEAPLGADFSHVLATENTQNPASAGILTTDSKSKAEAARGLTGS